MGRYKNNPWLGLESYKENQIIYGRNREIEELSQCVLNNHETVLYGKSGIGKSSIINAGILPVARANGYLPIVIRLDHSKKHSYIKQISDSIKSKITVSDCTIEKPIEEQLLWEFFHTHRFNINEDKRSKLIIIFDQFEEIFTLQTNAAIKGQFFKELGDVLNNVMPRVLCDETEPLKPISAGTTDTSNESANGFANMEDFFAIIAAQVENSTSKYIDDNDIHFVFTLREDFLSEFEFHTSKIPSLKQHRYSLRPLNEEQAAEIIMKPRPDLIDEDVARLIIETVTNRHDFTLDGEPEIDVDAAVLSLFLNQIYDKRATDEDVISIELIKTFEKDIIKDFYEESIEGLTPDQIDFLEEELLTGENRRDSLSKSDFKAGGFSEKDIKRLTTEKKLLRQFHYEGDLRIEFIHDVLCPVVKERKEQRAIQRQQEEERKRQEEEKIRIQKEAERKQRQVEEKAAREKAEMEAEALRVRQHNKRRLRALSLIIVSILLAFGSYYYCIELPYSVVYGNFSTNNGWPIGLGDQLSSSREKEKCTVYYRLSRDGRLPSFSLFGKNFNRPFTKVEILNWEGKTTTNVFIESPVVRIIDKELDDTKAAKFANLLTQVSYWLYTPDANGNISMKTAFDMNNQELYSENYSSTNNVAASSKHVLWCIYNDKKGNPLQISDNGTDRIRYTISDGYVTGCSFFTVLGTPQPNTSGDYGFSYQVDSISGNIMSMYKIDKFGDKIDSTLVHYFAFENGRYIKSDVCNVVYSKQNVIWSYKGHNDTIHVSDKGYIDSLSIMCNRAERIYAKYKSQDDLLEKKRIYNDTLGYSAKYYYSSKLDSIQIINKTTEPQTYNVNYSYPNKNVIEKSFWSNRKKIKLDINDIKCHKIRTDIIVEEKDSTIVSFYLDCDNELTQEGRYSKSEIIFDKSSGNVLFEYYYNSLNEICKSEMFTYNEYGIRESRAVAGIDRTPVRCPNWDSDGWCYYRMKFIKSEQTDHLYIATAAVDELGNWIPIIMAYDNEFFEFNYQEMPLKKVNEVSNEGVVLGEAMSNLIAQPISNILLVPYIHILSKNGGFYNAKEINSLRMGLKDGDIVYRINNTNVLNDFKPQIEQIEKLLNEISSNGGQISIMRIENGIYKKMQFKVGKGDKGAELHIAPINSKTTLVSN